MWIIISAVGQKGTCDQLCYDINCFVPIIDVGKFTLYAGCHFLVILRLALSRFHSKLSLKTQQLRSLALVWVGELRS